jgi:hypothetical protein
MGMVPFCIAMIVRCCSPGIVQNPRNTTGRSAADARPLKYTISG